MKLTATQQRKFNPHNVHTLEDLQNLPDDYHAVLAPSAMSRILKCPASVQESLEAPVKPPSDAALRGTMLHEVTHNILLMVRDCTELDDRIVRYLEYLSAKDAEQVMFCVDSVKYLLSFLGENKFKVTSFELEKEGSLIDVGMPFIHGTSDLVVTATSPDDKIYVFIRDWKYGFVEVPTIDGGVINPQLHVYGITQAHASTDFLNVGIVQPAHHHSGWAEISMINSVQWLNEYFIPIIVEAMGDKARFNPGRVQCRFCPADMSCRHRYNKCLETAREVFSVHKKLPHVTVEELVKLHLNAKEDAQYRSAIDKHLLSLALDNKPVPGMKAVHGRNQRKFLNAEQAETFLLAHGIKDEDLYTSKLISPAKAESKNRKLKKDEGFLSLIDIKPGKPQLVLEDDKREAITSTSRAQRAFHDSITEG